jgi:hypothetical protein
MALVHNAWKLKFAAEKKGEKEKKVFGTIGHLGISC